MIAESDLPVNITLFVFYLTVAFFLLGFLLGWISGRKGWTLGSKSSEPIGDPTLKSSIAPLLNPAGISHAKSSRKPVIKTPGIVQANSESHANLKSESPLESETVNADMPAAWQGLSDDVSAGRATIDDSLGLVYLKGPEHTDDLKAIKGVGRVLNEKLNSFGIYTYRQVAGWDDSIISEFSNRLSFKDRVKRDDWVAQAKALHKSKYEEELD